MERVIKKKGKEETEEKRKKGRKTGNDKTNQTPLAILEVARPTTMEGKAAGDGPGGGEGSVRLGAWGGGWGKAVQGDGVARIVI